MTSTLATAKTIDRAAARRAAGERAALRSFHRAVVCSRGYRGYLREQGIDYAAVARLDQVPYTDKGSLFAGPLDPWLDGGSLTSAAELLTSSGSSGLFSLGISSRAERRAFERTFDLILRELGAGEGTTTLVLNCLPMGIALSSRLATLATPSVHLEMSLELLDRVAGEFDRVVIAADPLFLKELGECARAQLRPGFARNVTGCLVGGEWVAESWRDHVSELFDLPRGSREPSGVTISMGAAEVGLHVLFETPALRAARRALDDSEARLALFGRDPGYPPTLLAWDPNRHHLEAREHGDGTATLVLTSLTRRLLPLVRYDLGDEIDLIEPWEANRELERLGRALRLEVPAVALWGRRGTELRGDGWSLRPERVKHDLFALSDHVGGLTGRFHLDAEGGLPALHVQLRAGASAGPGLVPALADMMGAATGRPATVHVHAHRAYPFHEAGDFQRKPSYIDWGG